MASPPSDRPATRPSSPNPRGWAARWRLFGKIAVFLLLVDTFVTLAQAPVVLRMAENAGHELCAMARRGELRHRRWPEQPRRIANTSPSVTDWLRRSAPLLAESCSVRVYPTLWPSGAVVLHIRPDAARNRALLQRRLAGHWDVGLTEGIWIAVRHDLLWTNLFDPLRSVGYDGRIEIF